MTTRAPGAIIGIAATAHRRASPHRIIGNEGYHEAMTEALSVPELARLCAEETARYARRESYAERPCLELFRRAITARDEQAWNAIYAQYTDSVRRWLGAWPGELDEGVAAAFERFWQALDSEKFARFGSLPAVLQYLKMCACSARLDRARATRSSANDEPLDAIYNLPATDNVEEAVTGHLEAWEFWHVVRDCLADERDRRVVYLSYVIGLSPRDICARHAAEFPDVTEVYRLKRNALDRLRRAPTMGAFVDAEPSAAPKTSSGLVYHSEESRDSV